ncbi:class II aldolase/adducin family protein [Lacrimispora sp. 210928-DFI.3.58]|nr:class II aldolase/adducin family protein [Lacrimispora sp. 210928-DFI.3.58]
MLEEIKSQVLEQALQAEKSGLCYPTSGNFSMIDEERRLVAITPKGKVRSTLKPEDIVLIDMEGNVVEAPEGFVPSSEKNLHLAIYKARKDLVAVAHTHAPYCSVFAALNLPVEPVLPEANRFDCRCPLAPYATPGSQQLADNVVETLGTHGVAVIMGQHGMLAASRRDMHDAYIKALYVEDVARTYYRMAVLVGLENVKHMSLEEYDEMMIALGKKEY